MSIYAAFNFSIFKEIIQAFKFLALLNLAIYSYDGLWRFLVELFKMLFSV